MYKFSSNFYPCFTHGINGRKSGEPEPEGNYITRSSIHCLYSNYESVNHTLIDIPVSS